MSDVFTYSDDYNEYEHNGKIYHEVDAKMLWSLTHLDGVMSGIANYNGQICYAKCHQSPHSWGIRYFWLYPLTPREVSAETKAHNWFRKYIGLHCDYDENGRTRRRKSQTWKEHYWDFMRFIWGKNLGDMRPIEKGLELDTYRQYHKNRDSVGYFTFERIRENEMDKGVGPMTKVEMKYHSNYWDGPLSGKCILQGKRRWFNCVHDYHDKTEDGEYLDMRIYAIYDLTEQEWKEEDYWHQLFENYVGTHTNYDESGNRTGKVHSSKTHSKFYDAAKEAWENRQEKEKSSY